MYVMSPNNKRKDTEQKYNKIIKKISITQNQIQINLIQSWNKKKNKENAKKRKINDEIKTEVFSYFPPLFQKCRSSPDWWLGQYEWCLSWDLHTCTLLRTG